MFNIETVAPILEDHPLWQLVKFRDGLRLYCENGAWVHDTKYTMEQIRVLNTNHHQHNTHHNHDRRAEKLIQWLKEHPEQKRKAAFLREARKRAMNPLLISC